MVRRASLLVAAGWKLCKEEDEAPSELPLLAASSFIDVVFAWIAGNDETFLAPGGNMVLFFSGFLFYMYTDRCRPVKEGQGGFFTEV